MTSSRVEFELFTIIKFNTKSKRRRYLAFHIDQQTDYLNCLLCKHCNWKSLSSVHNSDGVPFSAILFNYDPSER